MKKFRYLLVVGIILLDQIIKICIRNTMYIGESMPLIKDVFHITYVQNRGGAFSILSGQGFILTVVPLAAIIFAAWYMERHLTDHWSLPLSLCLIIGGGIGNLIDRIFLGFQIFSCIQYSGYSRMRGSRFSDTLYPLLFRGRRL